MAYHNAVVHGNKCLPWVQIKQEIYSLGFWFLVKICSNNDYYNLIMKSLGFLLLYSFFKNSAIPNESTEHTLLPN